MEERVVGRIVKRAFDIIFAAVFILVFSPIYILTPIIIMICSPGNPIYCARRVGLQGRVFKCYKFRSMRLDSGKVRLTTLQNDDRVFPFGKFSQLVIMKNKKKKKETNLFEKQRKTLDFFNFHIHSIFQ